MFSQRHLHFRVTKYIGLYHEILHLDTDVKKYNRVFELLLYLKGGGRVPGKAYWLKAFYWFGVNLPSFDNNLLLEKYILLFLIFL